MNNNSKTYRIYLLISAMSAIFLLFASYTTSPLTSGYVEWDSVIFMLLGRFWREGLTPYVDYFDHKGPVIFIIEYIGVSMFSNERLGVLLLQIISLSISQIFIFKSARLFLTTSKSLLVVVSSLLFLSLTLRGGNTTEEFSLPLLAFNLYYTLKFCLSEDSRIKFSHMFVIGISAAILFWLKPTNMGIAGACLLFIFIVCVRQRDKKGLLNLITGTLTGFILVSSIIVLYFISIGAFDEMIYAVFTFNFKYSANAVFPAFEDPGLIHYLKSWFSLIFFAVCIVFYILFGKRNKQLILLAILLFIFNLITTKLIGPGFTYYMTLNIPCVAFGIILCLSMFKLQPAIYKAIWGLVTILGVGFFLNFGHKAYTINHDKKHADFIVNIRNIAEQIPQNERNKVCSYNTLAMFWYYSELLPACKYFLQQELHGVADRKIFNEMSAYIISNPPIWIVLQTGYTKDRQNNPRFYEILSGKYYLFGKNTEFELYKLK